MKHLQENHLQSIRGRHLERETKEGEILASKRVARLPWGVHLLRTASESAATRAIWSRSPRVLHSTPPRSLSRSYAGVACQVASERQRQSTYTQLHTQMSMASSSGNKSDMLRTMCFVEWALRNASFVGLNNFSVRRMADPYHCFHLPLRPQSI